MNMLLDLLGNPLAVGDNVAIAVDVYRKPRSLRIGTIVEITDKLVRIQYEHSQYHKDCRVRLERKRYTNDNGKMECLIRI